MVKDGGNGRSKKCGFVRPLAGRGQVVFFGRPEMADTREEFEEGAAEAVEGERDSWPYVERRVGVDRRARSDRRCGVERRKFRLADDRRDRRQMGDRRQEADRREADIPAEE